MRANVASMTGYSAHADQTRLVEWCFPERHGRRHAAADVLFVNHGERAAIDALRRAIGEHGEALVGAGELDRAPQVEALGQPPRCYDLDRGAWDAPDGEPAMETAFAAELARLVEENRRLRAELERRP